MTRHPLQGSRPLKVQSKDIWKLHIHFNLLNSTRTNIMFLFRGCGQWNTSYGRGEHQWKHSLLRLPQEANCRHTITLITEESVQHQLVAYGEHARREMEHVALGQSMSMTLTVGPGKLYFTERSLQQVGRNPSRQFPTCVTQATYFSASNGPCRLTFHGELYRDPVWWILRTT